MKKKESIPQFTLSPVNSFIVRLNRPSFMMLITCYIALLLLVIFLVSPKNESLIIVPDYEHIIYPEDIHPQIDLFGNYIYDKETDKTTLRYNVSTVIQGRFNELNLDPGLTINRFMLSTHLTSNRMKYFTEQSGYKTQIRHSYTIDNTTISQVPKEFFSIIKYVDTDDTIKTATFMEQVMLEIKNISAFNITNTITHTEGEGDGQITTTDVRLNFGVTKEINAGTYTFSTRITVRDYNRPYHIDMQSWIVSIGGEAYPFIGVYGYQDQDSSFATSNRTFPTSLDPKYVYAQLNYYTPDQDVQTIRYRVLIDDLPNNTAQEPVYTDIPTPTSSIPWKTINLIGWPALVGLAVAGFVYYRTTRKKQNN